MDSREHVIILFLDANEPLTGAVMHHFLCQTKFKDAAQYVNGELSPIHSHRDGTHTIDHVLI